MENTNTKTKQEYDKQYYRKHRSRILEYKKQQCEKMSDSYIANLLNLSVNTVRQYPALIEARKALVMARRFLRDKAKSVRVNS